MFSKIQTSSFDNTWVKFWKKMSPNRQGRSCLIESTYIQNINLFGIQSQKYRKRNIELFYTD